jgi:hypothetical protein
MPEIISSIGKDGIDYIVYLKNTILGKDVDNAAFSFDPAKYRKVEIVDMRGI